MGASSLCRVAVFGLSLVPKTNITNHKTNKTSQGYSIRCRDIPSLTIKVLKEMEWPFVLLWSAHLKTAPTCICSQRRRKMYPDEWPRSRSAPNAFQHPLWIRIIINWNQAIVGWQGWEPTVADLGQMQARIESHHLEDHLASSHREGQYGESYSRS